jgi:hypothetical protein
MCRALLGASVSSDRLRERPGTVVGAVGWRSDDTRTSNAHDASPEEWGAAMRTSRRPARALRVCTLLALSSLGAQGTMKRDTPVLMTHGAASGAPEAAAGSPLLRQTPVLMAHDAASGALEGSAVPDIVRLWAQTQRGNLSVQLGCGARALDLRPCTHAWEKDVGTCHGGVRLPVGCPALPTRPSPYPRRALGCRPGFMVVSLVRGCGGRGRAVVSQSLHRA